MTPTPLEQIGWRSHRAGLWWLGLLYRRPIRFRQALESLSAVSMVRAGAILWLHILPYVVLICIAGRFLLFGVLELPAQESFDTITDHAGGLAGGIAIGLVLGLVVGLASRLAGGIAVGIVDRDTLGLAGGVAVGIAFGFAFGIAFGLAFGIAVEIVFGIALGIAGGIALVIAFGITDGLTFGIGLGMGVGVTGGVAVGIASGIRSGIVVGIAALRLYYYPIHLLYLWLKLPPKWYPWHPAAWDDMCPIPFSNLYRILVDYTAFQPVEGRQEIDRIVADYPSQQLEALKASIVLIAREAAEVHNLMQLEAIVARLPEGEKGVLGQTRRVQELVHEIAVEQNLLNTATRPILRQPFARSLHRTIENFSLRVSGFHEPLNREFRNASSKWLALAQRDLDDTQLILDQEPSPQVFRAGDPVDRDQEAFVIRHQVMDDLAQQLMLSTGCPGLILYGRRRVGKSTLLGDLPKFLPSDVIPVTMSMQHPEATLSLHSLVGYMAKCMVDALPNLKRPTDLPSLFEFLSTVNRRLEQDEKRMILAIDEYEGIDVKIGEGAFPIALLETLRESIQTHRRLIWLFAGSHHITELGHAPWTSYLVSARTIEVPFFTREETHMLLTDPLQHSSLWDKSDATRPRFAAEFWGPNGIDRIHDEGGGWPHLVQLIAETLIDLVNEENSSQVNDDLFERALDRAIVRGDTVLYQLIHGESSPDEWAYLSAFRRHETQPPPTDDRVYTALRRHQLVALVDDASWRLRVPLMARWLKERG